MTAICLSEFFLHDCFLCCIANDLKPVFFIYGSRSHKVRGYRDELLVWICLNSVKSVVTRIMDYLFQQLCGDSLALHLGSDDKAKYRFDLLGGVCWHILHKHSPATALQTICFCVGVTPAYGFPIQISEIPLNDAGLHITMCGSTPLCSSRKILTFIIVGTPANAVALMLIYIFIVWCHVKEAHIIIGELGCQSFDFNIHCNHLISALHSYAQACRSAHPSSPASA